MSRAEQAVAGVVADQGVIVGAALHRLNSPDTAGARSPPYWA